MMSTAAAAESVPLSCAMYSSDVALMERKSLSKSLMSLSPELDQTAGGSNKSSTSAGEGSRTGPCLRGLPGGGEAVQSEEEDRYGDDDLVTPCQGLLNKYTEFSTEQHPLQFNDHPQLKEIATANFKALMGMHVAGAVMPDSASTGGSEHTWQGSAISQLPSTITSPTTSYDAEQTSSQASLHNALPSLSGNKKTQYKKTKLCPWHRDGKCFMGAACNYAHSREELRPKPDLSKTKLCPELAKGRQCTHSGCRFAHDFVELRATSAFFKTRICKFWQRGICPAGAECRHAHGREDLRPSVGTGAELPAAPVSARQLPKRSLLSSSCSIQSDGAWTVDDAQLTHETVAPPASSIPSPSFLSTSASTPSPATQSALGAETAQLAQTLRQCAALLSENSAARAPTALVSDETSLNVLRAWIAQEVEKQVRQSSSKVVVSLPPPLAPSRVSSPASSFQNTPLKNREMPNFLPSHLIQGLNLSPSHAPPTFNPMEHGWLSPKADSASGDAGATPVFAGAVCGLFNGTSPPPGLLPTDWSTVWKSSSQHLGF
eukprot:Gregarina_sp_Pseudo_9__4398@NODE_455_length_2802_cov_137_699240_g431_i0_p1_GENE_NODE_455_length_2802_cov_137_699240_g431_i0NODE_455_length_2802_cov_137_699240_g431_i0_p1_ORF_typecomplete_len546_score113_77zfCCCH/PF00642_24/0_0017zfCCCH/PF00642_24/0_088zfCCCH/PF00642_24/1_9e07zfCCCH_3/PF15663_5/0_00059zfCCCH_3/PF15663_5/0_011Torus/PF16131_5/0_026Torus/PF16131_5/1_5e03Torus/PF16131_5/0_0031zfCCCH_4/PF18044_1/77zfCCCH_4/PF18044_1/65zfCCCH_4/PF18044_1/0_0019zf_CCCH_4/PF18345_1/1_8e02zf_CCCH_4/PF1834